MKSAHEELPPNAKILRAEDGFLRSVGLGAELTRPLSWVIDTQGIYYDATHASDLESLLSTTTFDQGLLTRAALLREKVVSHGLTKYNVGNIAWRRPAEVERVILVPGQVESDDSLKFGAPGIRSNIELLRAVKSANPRAHVIYKPHPDVVAGLRARGAGEERATQWCDELVIDTSMSDLLAKVDEVHVITSLAGFEGLLRHKPVTCYGLPFYAGWGLTADIHKSSRRRRLLMLDELVAGALILYPLYFSREARGALITPEQAIEELVAWRAKTGDSIPWWREMYRIALRHIVGVR